VKDPDRTSLRSNLGQRETLILAALALAALVIGWTLAAGGTALAGPLLQDSPIAAPQEQLSPLPTALPAVEPTQLVPTALPAQEPQPATPAAAQPPVPIAVLIGVMAVIGLTALIVALRRR
jgi:hypothetical protein